VDASRSSPVRNGPERALEAYRGLRASERISALGAFACLLSLFLPWYKVPFASSLVTTGWGAFGWATAALVLTLVAALGLLLRVGAGRRPPLLFREGTLLAIAGVWSAVIVGYLMLDRPNFRLSGFERDYSLAYGSFVALGGAAVLTLAGLRVRREEVARAPRSTQA
jgi:hypothetical protein